MEEQQQSQLKHNTLSKALVAAQKKIGSAKKGSANPFYKSKYADLATVIETVKEAMNDEGIAIIQPVKHALTYNSEGKPVITQYLETRLVHESGQSELSQTFIPTLADPQKQGAAITYFRRFALQSFLLVPAEDDDGNSLAVAVQEKVKKKASGEPIKKPGFLS